MKALILTAHGVEDSELLYPYYRLREANVAVDVAATEAGSVRGKFSPAVLDANMTFDQISTPDYDLLVLPGGKGPEKVRLHDRAVQVAKDMFENGKIVAAICHGAQILISAEVVDGKKLTCYKAIRDDVKAAGANYVDQEVVVDENLITSRKPSDLPAFCREVLTATM